MAFNVFFLQIKYANVRLEFVLLSLNMTSRNTFQPCAIYSRNCAHHPEYTKATVKHYDGSLSPDLNLNENLFEIVVYRLPWYNMTKPELF